MLKFLFALVLLPIAMGTSATETTSSAASSSLATVHQFGILRSNFDFRAVNESELLELPSFVHRAKPTTATRQTWLDFSALYIIPPQMMAGPMTFQVQQGGYGHITAWYPYSNLLPSGTKRARRWSDIHVGVQAEGLETTHPVWLIARRMEAAATLKVYKPGPTGSKPDDVGTTEGDVYLFMRGEAGAAMPLSGELDVERNEWMIRSMSIYSDTVAPFTTATRHGWIARAKEDGEVQSRRVMIDSGGLEGQRTSATVEQEPYSRETSDLRWQLNEAIVGNGLRPDEAMAQAELVIESLVKMRRPALLYMLSPQWADARFPLEVEGPAEKPVRVFIVIMELPTAGA